MTEALRTPLGVIGLLMAALSLLAYRGDWWWMFDIFANFRVQLAVVGVGILLGGLAMRMNPIVFIGAVVLMANLVPVVALYRGPGGAPTETQLSVASYNLRQSATEDRAEVVRWLREVDADIVFLHEASARWASFFDRSDVPYDIVGPQLGPGQPFGTMAFVRSGATVDVVDLFFRPGLAVTIDVAGDPVTVLGIHTVSPHTSERASTRDGDLARLAEWVVSQPTEVIVAGDLNATPFAWAFRQLLEASDLSNSQSGFGYQPTWPTGNILLRIPIDHVLLSDGLVVVDRRVGSSFGSDHFTVEVDLARVGSA